MLGPGKQAAPGAQSCYDGPTKLCGWQQAGPSGKLHLVHMAGKVDLICTAGKVPRAQGYFWYFYILQLII